MDFENHQLKGCEPADQDMTDRLTSCRGRAFSVFCGFECQTKATAGARGPKLLAGLWTMRYEFGR